MPRRETDLVAGVGPEPGERAANHSGADDSDLHGIKILRGSADSREQEQDFCLYPSVDRIGC